MKADMNADTRPITLHGRPALAPLFRLQWEVAQDAWVLLYPEGMVQLNRSAGEIMRRLDGQRTVAELIQQLEQDFSQMGLQDDVLEFLLLAQQKAWVRT